MAGKLEETTLRDFGGGWNVSDSDKSLSSRYQPISDNIVRGTDGHFRVRYGYELFTKLRNGDETEVEAASYTVTTVNGSSVVKITKTAHGYASGDHITISDFSATLNGITPEMMERTHGIVVNDADNFSIYVRGAASAGSAAARTIAYTHDTHAMSGRDIFGRYYRDNLIVFSENGEIVAINSTGVVTPIWNYEIAAGLTLAPWSYCKRVSAEIIRGRLIAVNGAENDKPIAIDDTTVNYLVDASTLSNSAIPRADFVIAAGQYIVLVSTEYGETMLEIGARNTVMTASREVDPSDAVELDVGMMTQTVDSKILGASVVRSRVFLGFTDRSMLGTLGIYNDALHEPDFNDNIAEFGTFSHASIISLGNDLFCAGMNGINSLEISRASGEFVPATISDLIHPAMLRHFARLSEDDRRYRTFAVFDNNSRSYMLFAPKYSDESSTMDTDPIVATTTLREHNLMYLRWFNHKLDEGDYVDISGVTDYSAALLGSMVNGRRRIRHIVDKSTVAIEVDEYPSGINTSFGGTAVIVTPVNDETLGYVYEYNPRLKIRRWTRFRNLQFDWGTRSQLNSLFFGRDGNIWKMGDASNPLSADMVNYYDQNGGFASTTTIEEGYRIRHEASGTVYIAKQTFTHSGSDIAEHAAANPNDLEEYLGEEISWAMDTAWSDFDMRKYNKEVELVGFDTEGSATFTFSIFTNSIYKDFESLQLAPVRESEFVGGNSPGFGAGLQPFGGGRNTAQEWLHSMPCSGKLFRFRFSGSSIHPLKITAVTLYYHKSKVLT